MTPRIAVGLVIGVFAGPATRANPAPEVHLLQSTSIPIISGGMQIGSMKLASGAVVSVLSTNEAGILVRRGEGTAPFLVPREAVAPAALSAALATPTPSPTPSPPSTTPFPSPTPATTSKGWPNSGVFLPKISGDEMISTSGKAGNITYTFHMPKDATDEDIEVFRQMDAALREATGCYNLNTTGIRQEITVRYSPGTATADGSSNGNIRLGRYARTQRVCMHEIAHTLGVGTSPSWEKLVVNGVFTGINATQALRDATHDPNAILHADRMHFWPYGLNYDSEVTSPKDFVNHCRIVSAIISDLKSTR